MEIPKEGRPPRSGSVQRDCIRRAAMAWDKAMACAPALRIQLSSFGGVVDNDQTEIVTEIVNVPARIAGDGHTGVPMSSHDLERLRREVMPPVIVQEAGPN